MVGILRRTTRRPAGPATTPSGAGPDALAVHADCVQAGCGWAATLTVTGYPAEVGAGWLEPLLAWPGRLEVAVHVTPIAPQVAATRLRKQRARLESARRHAARHDRLDDPDLDAAAADAAELAARVARGAGRLFRVAVTLTVWAPTRALLAAAVADVRAVAASMMLQTYPATWRAVAGYTTTLPLGLDLLGAGRSFDTDALAACFPFASPDLPAADPARPGAPGAGVLVGLNAASPGVVIHDRWAGANYNSVVLAASGAGKSYAAKLDVLRNLYQGVQVAVVDPENEYLRLAEAVGGAVIDLGAPGTRLNPLDLSTIPTTARPTHAGQPASGGSGPGGRQVPRGGQAGGSGEAFVRRVLFCHTLVAVLLGEAVSPAGTAALDTAVLAAYRAAGISADPRTWARPAPLLADVAEQLQAAGETDPAARQLAHQLAPYATGSFSGLFAGPTTVPERPSHLAVYALKRVPDELRTAASVLALDAIWRQVTHGTRRRRIVVVDEGWQLLGHHHGAQFLYRLAKSARKHWCGLTVVTQDADDVLASRLGRAVIHNAATSLLLGQQPTAIDQIADAFNLTTGETQWLLAARVGHGLLLRGRDRVPVIAHASATEHDLITTDPAELAELDDPDHP